MDSKPAKKLQDDEVTTSEITTPSDISKAQNENTPADDQENQNDETSLLIQTDDQKQDDPNTKPSDTDEEYQKLSKTQWISKLFKTYDPSFLSCLKVIYFNEGFKSFMGLSVMDLFKDYLKLQPAEMQVLSSIIGFPWCIKLVYGLIADNIPLFGSKRKSYLILNGLLSFLFLLPLIPDWITSKYIITVFLTLNVMNTAFLNVVIDGLMVSQARRDTKRGSQDLNSYSWGWMAIGGIVGSLMAAYLTEYFNPHFSFGVCSLIGLFIALNAMQLNIQVEEELKAKPNSNIKTEIKKNLESIYEALKMPQIYKTLLYFALCGVLIPSFGDVHYFFQLNVLKFSKFTYSMLTLLSFVSLLGGTLIYNKYLQNWEFRTLLQLSTLCSVIGCIINLLLVLRVNIMLGISDLAFVILTGIISDTMSLAFSFLPTLVLFSKITPFHIEATVFAMLTGVFNFVNNVGGPLLGSFITTRFGVDGNHLDKFYILLIIQLVTVLVSFFYIWLVPLKSEINRVQEQQIQKANDEKESHLEETLENDALEAQ